jgi:GrpB-like predicted nucleotidyltransferase (UPF0157 family)
LSEPEIFHIREIDRDTLASERDRALRLVQKAVPFASVMEVGSTAVPDVVGKQDLDFVVRVPQNRFEKTRELLDNNFRRNDLQLSNEEYQGYLVSSSLDVAIQLIVENGKYDDFETFLQLLRTNPDVRFAYNALKLAWNGQPMEKYRAAKQDFISATLENKS